ncbi:MAG: SigE family RNA polymerase sigma factor [Hamadaea sp.]|uniref:SigE family RNA polymerase sigma factor n=1 Tax=Hamadaea sp. TaxID=2024425 RepID=UPI0017902403|nr:SigE family RNA polymerase sigma factor [Hamadaea sp.]NUR69929.1 SigE family RNA polymerase sigma factor [Hamadaea sp.]NUT22533.1 SigE family RNA polymerase sigma factor [Hamadaea sp.]
MPSEDGFREFVEARYVELLRIAYLLTGSTHEAEDLVQSALVRTMRAWSRVDEPMPYVRRVMVNQHISVWRRVRRRELVTDSPPDVGFTDAAEAIAQRHAVRDALRSLPPRTRAVVVLRYLGDMSEAEVAAALGCSLGNVKSHASRGLARLRAVLDPVDLERMPL